MSTLLVELEVSRVPTPNTSGRVDTGLRGEETQTQTAQVQQVQQEIQVRKQELICILRESEFVDFSAFARLLRQQGDVLHRRHDQLTRGR